MTTPFATVLKCSCEQCGFGRVTYVNAPESRLEMIICCGPLRTSDGDRCASMRSILALCSFARCRVRPVQRAAVGEWQPLWLEFVAYMHVPSR